MNKEIEIDDEYKEDFSRIAESLSKVLIESNTSPHVCVFALIKMLIIATYRMNISKPHLLNLISEEWEFLDERMEKQKNDQSS